jgi:Na+/H+ antiporter NhaB
MKRVKRTTENEEVKVLSEIEMLKIEIGNLKKQLIESRIETAKQKNEAISMYGLYHKAMADNKNLELKLNTSEMIRLHEENKKETVKHKQFIDEIKAKNGIETDLWGFDPLTGEIKTE